MHSRTATSIVLSICCSVKSITCSRQCALNLRQNCKSNAWASRFAAAGAASHTCGRYMSVLLRSGDDLSSLVSTMTESSAEMSFRLSTNTHERTI